MGLHLIKGSLVQAPFPLQRSVDAHFPDIQSSKSRPIRIHGCTMCTRCDCIRTVQWPDIPLLSSELLMTVIKNWHARTRLRWRRAG